MKKLRIHAAVLVLLLSALALHAQETSLSLTGDPGDFIVGPQSIFLTPADGNFSVSQNFDNGVSMSFFGNQLGEFWFLDFAAPNHDLLTVGTYSGATRFPFQLFSEPGLSLDGDGRGCNTLTGSFVVREISYGPAGTINSFDATFEQHCEGGVAAARGEIRYNAHPVITLTAPAHLTVSPNQNVNFTVSATDALSRHVVLTATGMPAGATFFDNGNNTGTFNWTPTGTQTGNFFVTFLGDNQSGDTGVTATQISVIPPPPPNDDFSHPTVVPSIPFTVSQNVTNATTAFDDPFCQSRNQTVWFSFTPAQNIRIEANTFGSNYDTTLGVFTGTRGALVPVACNDDSNGTLQSRVRFNAVAGTTYYFMVGSFSFFNGFSPQLTFNVLLAPPPLSIAPAVTQFGSIDPPTGVATISGFVRCSEPAFVTLSGQLKQTHGNVPLTGFFSVFLPCNGTTPWSTSIQTAPALFHGRSAALFTGGKADVSATASAFDFENGQFVQKSLAATITLRGKN
jgi:hypothetical protein